MHEVKWTFSPEGKPLKPQEVPESSRVIKANLILLAMGFTGVPKNGIVEELNLQLSPRNGILADPEKRIYAVGDCVTGASLVVRAMADAKKTVEKIRAGLV